MKATLAIQLLLFLVVACFMFKAGDYRFASAQALLFGVNLLLFWPVLSA